VTKTGNYFVKKLSVRGYLAVGAFILVIANPAFSQGTTIPSAVTDRTLSIKVASGGDQRALYVSPAHPLATVVMLPGGAGDVGIEADGSLEHSHNFVVRSRALWVARGFAVLIADAVDDQNLRGARSSPAYGALVGDLVAAAKAQNPAPVFLLGTSQGSIAAMNGAAHLRDGQTAGVVLTESVSRLGGSGETVFDAHPDRVRVPALVVANQDDRCSIAPPQDADKIGASMLHSPRVKILRVSGGDQRSRNDCGSLSPHGYDGIEGAVVDGIAAWMKGVLGS
jgi:hypothetical protein